MQNSVIALFLFSALGWGAEAKYPQGCVIPESGPQKGILPKGCEASEKTPRLFNEFQVRCKVTEVRCDSKIRGGYVAVAKVEQWLKGSGPNEIAFKFVTRPPSSKKSSQSLNTGKGLCADLTLAKKADDWVLIKVENLASSSDALPTCP
jgi:hypothetical protein